MEVLSCLLMINHSNKPQSDMIIYSGNRMMDHIMGFRIDRNFGIFRYHWDQLLSIISVRLPLLLLPSRGLIEGVNCQKFYTIYTAN